MYRLLFILVFISLNTQGQNVLSIKPNLKEIELNKYCTYLLSKKNKYAIQDLLADSTIVFIKNQKDLMLFEEGEYIEDVWIKINIVNKCKEHKQLVLELNNPLIDYIKYYNIQQNKIIDSNLCGDVLPFTNRNINYRNPLYLIKLFPTDTQQIFFKLNAGGRKLHIPLSLKLIDTFIESSAKKNLVLGGYYGVLAIITLLSLYLAYILIEKVFLLFAIYILFLLMTQMCLSGVAYQYFWPNFPKWNASSVTFFMAISLIVALAFVESFISKKYMTKKIIILLYLNMLIPIGIAIASLLGPVSLHYAIWVLYRFIPVIYTLLLLIGIVFLINKFKSARIFVPSLVFGIISIGVMLFYNVSGFSDNIFTNNFVVFAVTLKCLLLSIALLDRLKIFKEEKEKIQVLQIQQLEELNRYKERINSELLNTVEIKSLELSVKQNEIKRALFFGEEKERKRVAQDLHDGMGSLLSTLKLNAESIDLSSKKLEKNEAIAYQNVLEMIDKACTELRNISHNLMPSSLEHFGLKITLESLIERINSNGGTHFSFQIFNLEEKIDAQIEINIYRIILELVNNIIKHAKAKKASIQLIFENQLIMLITEDDGIGFNYSNQKVPGTGLLNIKSRTESMNGKINIDSKESRGTTIIIEIPIYTNEQFN
jgi:signal transduction histidine kinase